MKNAFAPKKTIRNFKDLEVWKLGKYLAKQIYFATRPFPDEEKFGLVSQMRRAGVSIPSNIAEGFNRYHNAEYKHFLYIALGSCAELETQLEISFELGFLAEALKTELLDQLDYEQAMLRNLIKKL